MKKLALVLAVVGFAAVSCKKDYTCDCTTTSNIPGYAGVKTSSTAKMKKKDAEDWCTGLNSSTTTYGFTYTNTCALK